MLEICRKKIEEESDKSIENIDLVKGDMRDSQIGRKFDLVIAPCHMICHLIEISDFKDALSYFKEHLAEDGVLVIDNSRPDIKNGRK